MDIANGGRKRSFSGEHGKTTGISFDSDPLEKGSINNNSNKRVLTKRKSTFQIDPFSSSTHDKDENNGGWQKYEFMRVLRRKILIDLERHFGRKVEHDRLFSCLGNCSNFHILILKCFGIIRIMQ